MVIKNIVYKTKIEIIKELTETIRKNITIDWYGKESVQAKMRKSIRRLLRKYGYPEDKASDATDFVLKQAKVMCEDIAI